MESEPASQGMERGEDEAPTYIPEDVHEEMLGGTGAMDEGGGEIEEQPSSGPADGEEEREEMQLMEEGASHELSDRERTIQYLNCQIESVMEAGVTPSVKDRLKALALELPTFQPLMKTIRELVTSDELQATIQHKIVSCAVNPELPA
eukprot:825989-Rhodomonas_salina.1